MKFTKISSVVLVCALLIIASKMIAQNNIIWKDLKSGDNKVGFKVFQKYDHSRTFKPKYDFEGNLIKEENSRLVQISVWYPAKYSGKKQHMTYGRYTSTNASKFNYSFQNKNDRSDFISRQKLIQRRRGADSTKIEKIYSMQSFAVLDAPFSEGKFPLIIYSPGLNGSAFQNYLLFEYLASHGYIIASSPSFGQFSRNMTPDIEGIEAQVRDIEFIFKEMRNFPNVDIYHVGAMGMSWGGLSNVIFAFRNFNVGAVACLEGSILYGSGPKKLKTF